MKFSKFQDFIRVFWQIHIQITATFPKYFLLQCVKFAISFKFLPFLPTVHEVSIIKEENWLGFEYITILRKKRAQTRFVFNRISRVLGQSLKTLVTVY